MRLLLIVEDPDCQALLQQHVRNEWPNTEFVVRVPRVSNVLPSEFLAQGYDAVIVDQHWQGGKGLYWLRELAGRPGFAPALLLVDRIEGTTARKARLFGAFGVLPRADFLPATLVSVTDRSLPHAAPCPGVLARFARGRGSAALRCRAHSRLPLRAAPRRRFGLAAVLGREREGRRPHGGQGHAVRSAMPRASTSPSSASCRNTRSRIACAIPASCVCHELGVADDHAYLAMEYFPDGDLRRRIRAGITPADALDLSAQIAGALAALHDAGALHRDLKPGNVLMRGTRQIALSDFGLAKDIAWDMEITDPGLIFGTPQYMSPEQGHGEPVDARSDLYSLGVILYEMLAGEKPYAAANPMSIIYMHRNQPIPKLPAPVAHWQPLVESLLAKLPKERYRSAREAEDVLRQAADTARAA